MVKLIKTEPSDFKVLYDENLPIKSKIEIIAKEIYGCTKVLYAASADKTIKKIEDMGYDKLPICMAKTQYSLSDDPANLGRPSAFTVTVREFKPSIGAGFIVALTGEVMTMPGLPKVPAAMNMDVDENGKAVGLF